MLFNRPRAVEYMRHCGLDALIATSPINITYFSDYHCWIDPLFKEYMMAPGASSHLAQAYALFPLEGEPALIVNPFCAVNATELWVCDLYSFGNPLLDDLLPRGDLPASLQPILGVLDNARRHATSTDALLHALQERGLLEAQIGVEFEGLAPPDKAALLSGLPGAAIKDSSNLIRLLRAVKSPDEIARLRRAAEIAERAAMESLSVAQVGQPAREMVDLFRTRVAAMGADFDHFVYGVRGMGFATETPYLLAEDDLLEVDYGCIYGHCFADSGTTLAMRQPSATMLERHAALRAAIDAGAAIMKPGVRSSAVQVAMQETLSAQGVLASFPHGHSLGLEVRDYPIIVADNGLWIRDDCIDVASDLPLEADMVINLEAAIRMPAVGSLHIEQTFLVTALGSDHLVAQDRSHPFVPETSLPH